MQSKVPKAAKTVWERTNAQCLLRNKQSGGYYARFTLHGKQKWLALDTDVFTVAKLRLADRAAEIKKLTKTWKGIEYLEPKNITPKAICNWASRFKAEGTGFIPPGAKSGSKGNSASSVNRAIDTLHRLLDIAIEQGQVHANPVLVQPPTGKLKKKVVAKKLVLPSRADVEKIFSAMGNNGAPGGWEKEAADFCRDLMYTGARVSEMPRLRWGCIDRPRKLVHLQGK